MYVYKIPKTFLQRLLINDQSGNFKIIIAIKYTKKQNDDIEIQKQKKIIINTTVNKARLLSKKIDEQFVNDQRIDQYIFTLGNHNCQIEDISDIMHSLIESNGNDVTINEDKRNLFNQILSILDNGGDDIELGIIECKYLNNDNKFNGIISYIKKSTKDAVDGNNDHLRLSGTGMSPYFPISNLLLYDDPDVRKSYVNTHIGQHLEEDAFIEFDFVNRKINLTSYTIQTIYNATGNLHPKTWKMVGSNDHNSWELIDLKENNDELNGPSKCAHFECSTPGKYYRYIKYVQIDNWRASYHEIYKYYVGLSRIEFFGSIKSE